MLFSCKTQKSAIKAPELAADTVTAQAAQSFKMPEQYNDLASYEGTYLINGKIRGKLVFLAYPKLNKMFIKVGREVPLACPLNTNFNCELNLDNSLEFVKIFTGGIVVKQIYPPSELAEATTFEEPVIVTVKDRSSQKLNFRYHMFSFDDLKKQIRCEKDQSQITVCFTGISGKKYFYRFNLEDFEQFDVIRMELDILNELPSFVRGE